MIKPQSANERKQSAKIRSLPEQDNTSKASSKASSKAAAVKATAATDDPATKSMGKPMKKSTGKSMGCRELVIVISSSSS